jgi:hypothetical protein
MTGSLRPFTIRNLVSPTGLALISYVIFLFAWVFPPSLYASYIREPDRIFLDPISLAFVTACVLAFMVGSRLCNLFGVPFGEAPKVIPPGSPLTYLLTPLIISSAFCLIYLFKVGSHLDFVGLLASSQGNSIKLANQTGQLQEGFWGRSPSVLCATIWWAQYRAGQLQLKGFRHFAFTSIFLLALLVDIATCTATVNRTNLMPLITGMTLIYTYRKTLGQNVNGFRILMQGAFAAAAFFSLFLLLSFFRGSINGDVMVTQLLGYGITSYNRLAVMLTGHLQFVTGGKGVYLFPVLIESHSLNVIFHISDRFGWPSPDTLWRLEFGPIAAAGLNEGFNWVSLFGYIHSDIGWFTPIYFSGLGVLCGRLWLSFRKGKSFGVVLYPWVAFSILFWCGYNVAFSSRVIAVIEIAVALAVWDWISLGRRLVVQNYDDTRLAASQYTPLSRFGFRDNA